MNSIQQNLEKMKGRYSPERLAQYRQIILDPWEFCKILYTKDEVDASKRVKRFPYHYSYLPLYIRVWQREPLLIVPKSRRMFMTWTNVALYLHDTVFKSNGLQVFQSKKEEDSDALIERAKFILDNISEEDFPRDLIPQYDKTYCQLKFPDMESSIMGIGQGADQLRQYTCSGMLLDEFAFWSEAEDTFSAAKPTLEGGGRCTILSSASPGYMQKLVYDTIDDQEADPYAVIGNERFAR